MTDWRENIECVVDEGHDFAPLADTPSKCCRNCRLICPSDKFADKPVAGEPVSWDFAWNVRS